MEQTKTNRNTVAIRKALTKRNAILLFSSCIAQLFIWCVNPGKIDSYKYILSFVSIVFMILLLRGIWLLSDHDERARLLLRMFIFVFFFNLVIIMIGHYFGGFIGFACGIVAILSFWKIDYPVESHV